MICEILPFIPKFQRQLHIRLHSLFQPMWPLLLGRALFSLGATGMIVPLIRWMVPGICKRVLFVHDFTATWKIAIWLQVLEQLFLWVIVATHGKPILSLSPMGHRQLCAPKGQGGESVDQMEVHSTYWSYFIWCCGPQFICVDECCCMVVPEVRVTIFHSDCICQKGGLRFENQCLLIFQMVRLNIVTPH